MESEILLGRHWSYNLYADPKRLAFVLSRYKFAAQLACHGRDVIELGCSEGIGAPVLARFAKSYTGVDLDESAIASAKENFLGQSYNFIQANFLGRSFGHFDVVVSLDVIEHISADLEDQFFDTVVANMRSDGICIVGTPNVSATPYASAASQAGHINLYDAPRLANAMKKKFHNVFNFGINDETVHTGFSPMCHYLVCVGCNRIGDLNG